MNNKKSNRFIFIVDVETVDFTLYNVIESYLFDRFRRSSMMIKNIKVRGMEI